jgi:hypothetical protein
MTANASHVVNMLTFGQRLPDHLLRKVPDDVRSNIDPLAGKKFVNLAGHMSHEHHIKVVSTHYETGTLIGHSDILGYQVRRFVGIVASSVREDTLLLVCRI